MKENELEKVLEAYLLEYPNEYKPSHRRHHYKMNVTHDDRKRPFQNVIKQYKTRAKKKGMGRNKKIKGETLTTGRVSANDKIGKSWQVFSNHRENFAFTAIYMAT